MTEAYIVTALVSRWFEEYTVLASDAIAFIMFAPITVSEDELKMEVSKHLPDDVETVHRINVAKMQPAIKKRIYDLWRVL